MQLVADLLTYSQRLLPTVATPAPVLQKKGGVWERRGGGGWGGGGGGLKFS